MSLHTSAGCSLASKFNQHEVTSNLLHSQCASSGSNNQGCGFLDTDPNTYGHEFNLLSGGVFAHLWDNTGIKIWRFSRPNIPADITSKNPDPSTWGTPAANFPATNCDIASHFFEHNLVIDTTLCGDFAGATYGSSGCPGTCGQAVANPANFKCEYLLFNLWQLPVLITRSLWQLQSGESTTSLCTLCKSMRFHVVVTIFSFFMFCHFNVICVICHHLRGSCGNHYGDSFHYITSPSFFHVLFQTHRHV